MPEADQLWFLSFCAFLMGLGKGGVPGASTSTVAMTALFAPEGAADAAVSLQVPITTMADCTVASMNYKHADWDAIFRLLKSTVIGLALGSQIVGKISDANARLLIGSILLLIIAYSMYKDFGPKAKLKKDKDGKPIEADDSFTRSWWFVGTIGIFGGLATILTNSMGPMLNAYLLTLKLSPSQFVGTRSCFFMSINFTKLALRLYNGTLSMEMLWLGSRLGLISMIGVFCSKFIMARMSRSLFTKLEYGVVSVAGIRLVLNGLGIW